MDKFLTAAYTDDEKVVREYVGFVLRHLREDRGITQRKAADELSYASSLVAMVEVGMRIPSPEFLKSFEDNFGCSGLARATLKLLATKKHTWMGRSCPELELESRSLMYWAPQILPDFLQTGEYAREVRGHHLPALSRKEEKEAEEKRLLRSEIFLGEDRPATVVVLDESVLRRCVGSEAIMRRQVDNLLIWAEHPAVMIQVVPFDAPSYLGLLRPAVVALHEGSHQLMAYVEHHVGSTLIHGTKEVNILTQHFGNLRAHAMPPRASGDLIAQIAWKR